MGKSEQNLGLATEQNYLVPSFIRKTWRFVTRGHIFAKGTIEGSLRKNIGDFTFAEAYKKTGRIINITISDAKGYEGHRVLNHITAPNVLIWSAALSSCS
jgi:predicted acylesterase/phospholipase RssA